MIIKIFSFIKILVILNLKFRKQNIINIFIKKKIRSLKYINLKKNLLIKKNFKNKLNLILINSIYYEKIIHCLKHFFKKNHNSIIENTLNEIF